MDADPSLKTPDKAAGPESQKRGNSDGDEGPVTVPLGGALLGWPLPLMSQRTGFFGCYLLPTVAPGTLL